MQASAQRDLIDVVLVSPRNPLNIGSVARAMTNFGFSHLTVVAPYEPHWREAKSAVGARNLLQTAKCAPSLAEAIASATFVLGTASIGSRQPEQRVIALSDLASLVYEKLAGSGRTRPAARIALVFGQEKRGLTREDLALCHGLLTIPTSATQPSMNLGQAVAVCLYELAARLKSNASSQEPIAEPPATSERLQQLSSVISEMMHAAEYSPATMHSANEHDTQLLLRRLALNERDAIRILGLFRRILWRLKH